VYSCGPQRHVRVAATGFGTPPGRSSPTAPKAIIEVIGFNGDGTVDMPKVTLSVNGTVINESPGELRHLHHRYVDCERRMHGNPQLQRRGPKLRYSLRPSGDSDISLIQTDKGNGFRGTATRRAH
jgi:hypothetical protein